MPDSIRELSESLDQLKVELEVLRAAGPNVTAVAVDGSTLKDRIGGVEKALAKPVFKDVRFWAGIAAIPILIVGGWTVDKIAGGKPLMLSMIHQALGTQPVVINALETKGDPVYGAMQDSLQALLDGNHTLDAAIGKVVDEKLQIVGSGLLSLGFVRPDLLREIPCGQYLSPDDLKKNNVAPDTPCEDTRTATIDSSTGVFGLRAQGKVNIVLGVYTAELVRKQQDTFEGAEVREFNGPPLNQLVDVQLDDNPLEVGKVDSWVQSKIGEQTMRMAYLRLEGQPLDRALDFPLHTLTVSLKQAAPKNVVVSVAYIINAVAKSA